ncbi:MAG: hypothetical protein R3E09_05785 [Novosphingobium sp.]
MVAVLGQQTSVTATPISGALGARVDGLDLAVPVDDETLAVVRQALLDHLVLH